MKISIICTEPGHPILHWLHAWQAKHSVGHTIEILRHPREAKGGDVLFLVSCHDLVDADIRALYTATLVIHGSDLPHGRGWSPVVWQVLEGRRHITVSLLSAADRIDSGDIWHQIQLHLDGHEIADEINAKLFDIEIALMDHVLLNWPNLTSRPQGEDGATYYRRRIPEDSRIDPRLPLLEFFNLLRIADPRRYPVFFDHLGHRYYLTLSKEPPHVLHD